MEPHGFTPVVPTLLSFGAASRCLTIHPWVYTHGFLEIGINAFIYPLEKEKTHYFIYIYCARG